jgi:ketol-acid reductoisomerase
MQSSISSPQKIAIVGYGNQGRAWALNLRDSGFEVRVCTRSEIPKKDAFTRISTEELKTFDGPIALLLPDDVIPEFYKLHFEVPLIDAENDLRPSRTFVFAHGFSVLYDKIDFQKNDELLLCAPKGIGTKLREKFKKNSGVMGVIAALKGNDKCPQGLVKARAIADGLGCGRIGIIEASFKEEVLSDLFSEQVLLCGGVPKLIDRSVRVMIDKGIPPRLAVYECLHELKLIVDMMVEFGIEGMFHRVSQTALIGGLDAASKILPDEDLDKRLAKIWERIESGRFAKEIPNLKGDWLEKKLQGLHDHPIDQNL